MRRLAWVIALGIIGCSSDNSGGNTTGTPHATTIAVAAGDNQTATAGSAVAIRPSVIVRDQDGHPMSGATVTFTVDSGGGTVAGSSPATGSDGVAAVGSWTLGGVAGRNRLKATTGSLAPVFFTATAIVTGGSTLADVTIPSSGGTITVSKAGDPLNGMQLVVPPGAFGAAVEFTIAPATVPAPHEPA